MPTLKKKLIKQKFHRKLIKKKLSHKHFQENHNNQQQNSSKKDFIKILNETKKCLLKDLTSKNLTHPSKLRVEGLYGFHTLYANGSRYVGNSFDISDERDCLLENL